MNEDVMIEDVMIEVVKRLIGKVEPTGDHGTDVYERQPNLEKMIALTDYLFLK